MERSSNSDNLDLRELLKPLLMWWWLLAACTLLAAVSSGIYTRQRPLVYQSTTTLMVGTALFDPNPNSGEFGLANQLAIAYADVAKRPSLRDATKESLDMTWLPDYDVRHIANTQFLEISVVDTVPTRTQIVAHELANQLILESPGADQQQGRQQFIEEQLNQLEAGIVDTKTEIERLELELTKLFSARQIADTRVQIDALQTKLVALQSNYAALLESSRRQATNTLVVVEPASLPARPLNSDLPRNVVVAAAIGFAMAAAAAYLLEFGDDTLKSDRDVYRWFGITALGAIPKSGRTSSGAGSFSASSPHRTAQSDAYAALGPNVLAAIRRLGLRTLLVTCPALEDGRPVVAANLCHALAHTGLRVALIDADLYRPSQHRLFGLPNRAGLTTALMEHEADLEPLLQSTSEPQLSVITSGPLPGNPAALLASQPMRMILSRLREQVDLVVLDAPPIASTVDPAILAAETDGVLLVIAAARTTRTQVAQAIKVLAQVDAQPLGFVLDEVQDVGGRSEFPFPYGHRLPQARPASTLADVSFTAHINGNGNPEPASLPPISAPAARTKRYLFGGR